MRLFLIASLTLAAFALGIAVGGQIPREAAAQDGPPEGLEWEIDGDSLILSNTSADQAFVILGWQEDGAAPQLLPPRSNGKLVLAAEKLDGLTIYRMEQVMGCNPRECVLCTDSPIHCPIPPRPPIGNEFQSILGPYGWEW